MSTIYNFVENVGYTVQKDVEFLASNYSVKNPLLKGKSKELQIRVALAALRVFGALIMGASILSGVSAFRAFILTGATLKLALNVLCFALGHDIFKVSAHIESSYTELKANIQSIFIFIEKTVQRNEGEAHTPAYNEAYVKAITEDTFFKSIYQSIALKIS
jgi:hypothetical protein